MVASSCVGHLCLDHCLTKASAEKIVRLRIKNLTTLKIDWKSKCSWNYVSSEMSSNWPKKKYFSIKRFQGHVYCTKQLEWCDFFGSDLGFYKYHFTLIFRVYAFMSCFDKTANGWLHKNITIHGPKIHVVFELTAAYAPEKGTINHINGC